MAFREVPFEMQTLFACKPNTKEALEHARSLIPDVPHNTFMQAMMVYHNTLVYIAGGSNVRH